MNKNNEAVKAKKEELAKVEESLKHIVNIFNNNKNKEDLDITVDSLLNLVTQLFNRQASLSNAIKTAQDFYTKVQESEFHGTEAENRKLRAYIENYELVEKYKTIRAMLSMDAAKSTNNAAKEPVPQETVTVDEPTNTDVTDEQK